MKALGPSQIERLRGRLVRLYGERAAGCLEQILAVVERRAERLPRRDGPLWDQRDTVLITYGDQVRQAAGHALPALRQFLRQHQLERLIRTVHLLPFFPSSSDDGFAVVDYRNVDPAVGDWQDVRQLGQDFNLMFDLVLNHVSAGSAWFRDYLAGRPPHAGYFIEADSDFDVSRVTRPRSLPLLTEFETSRGPRRLWTTFSADQIDLNFAQPEVLVEMIDVLLFYVQQGARILRLDAVAYLWKRSGTTCIHLPETHEIVKVLRDLLEAAAPGVILLTETNVPHAENISYFGDGDEAHMVYQFSLPPLLLDAFLNADAGPLTQWLAALQPAPPRATFFNFTASHDGVGVRPLEGLVDGERLERLVAAVRERGGLVSTRRQADGRDTPYELNVSYVDALGEPGGRISDELHARRFLASQALMLSLQGVPGIYFHSLVGSPNDVEGARQSQQPRRINRRKYELDELNRRLADGRSTQARIFRGYQRLLEVRTRQPAFHPDAPQQVWPSPQPALFGLRRSSPDGRQQILVIANVSPSRQRLQAGRDFDPPFAHDLLSGVDVVAEGHITLEPFQVVWLEAR